MTVQQLNSYVLGKKPLAGTRVRLPEALEPLRGVFNSADLRRVMPGLALSSLMINLLALGLPLGLLQIMDRVIANQSLQTLTLLVLGIVAVMILEELLRTTNTQLTGWLGARFEHAKSVETLAHLMRVPLRKLEAEEAGVHAERIAAAGKVADFYSGQALLIVFDLPFVLLFLMIIFLIGGWIVLVPIVLLLIFVYVISRFGSTLRQQVEERYVLDDRRRNFLLEVLGGMLSVKTLGLEAQMERRNERLLAGNAKATEGLAYGSSMATNTGMLFTQVMIVGVVFAGAWSVIAGAMTPGGLAACMLLSVRALQPLRRCLTVWLRYQSFVSAQQHLRAIGAMPVLKEKPGQVLPPVKDCIELVNVCIDRSTGNPLFKDLSLRIAANECLAIRGESGSGKSSLLSLINGIDQPDRGAVTADGRLLTEFSADSVQRQIALISQNSTIISGTILENMTMFDARLNSRALEIAGSLGLDRIVAGMKLGYETPLGEGSAETLPIGFRQLIAMVRSLTPNPSVILFDEANIGLDMKDDQRVRDYLSQCKGKQTLILVTHRPSLLALADRVLVIRDGRLVEGNKDLSLPEINAKIGETSGGIPERPLHENEMAEIISHAFMQPNDLSNCLLPMLDALQWNGRGGELAEAIPHWTDSLDLPGFCSIMANLQMLPNHFVSPLSRLDDRLLPCLYVPKDTSAMVIIERLPSGQYRAIEGASGKERLLDPTDSKTDFYLFKPCDDDKQSLPAAPSWFGGLFQRFQRYILMAFGLTVVSTILALAAPLFVRSIYDHVLPAGDVAMQSYLLLGIFLAFLLDFLLRRLKSRIVGHIGGRAEYLMGTRVFQQVISLPSASIQGASVSRQVGRLRNYESLRDFFTGPLTVVGLEMPASLILIVAVGIMNPWALAVILAAILAFVALAFGTHERCQTAVARTNLARDARWEFLNEAITRMRMIQNSGCRGSWLSRYQELSGKAVMAQYRDNQIQARVAGTAQLIGSLTGLATLGVSTYEAIQGQLSGGALIASMILVWRLTGPMQNAFHAMNALIKIRSNVRQIENLLRMPTETNGAKRQVIRPATEGALSLARVSFRYSNDADPALLGVSLDIAPGRLIVITGSSGAGKSTLLKLIERTYLPQAGTIRLGAIDIRQIPVSDLRAQLSYMPQSCDLFYGTVSQNIRLAYPAATDAEVRWATEMAGLTDDIEALPEKIETRISNSRAAQLPNGFKQKLGLARAIIKPAEVVMLDEPGTGLDAQGEEALLRCIQWLRGRSTVLVVSHRPGHMRLADSVVYMERGSIAALGPYETIEDRLMSGMQK